MDGAAEAGRLAGAAESGARPGPPPPEVMKAAVAVARPGRASTDKARLEESAGARPHEVQKVGQPRPTARQALPPGAPPR